MCSKSPKDFDMNRKKNRVNKSKPEELEYDAIGIFINFAPWMSNQKNRVE
jgi:hypothetical protein